MPKCPKCEAEINSLFGDFMEWNRYVCTTNAKGDMGCDFKEVGDTADPDGDSQHYYCPNCDVDLFDKYSEAEAFLNGEEVETRED